MLKTTDFNSDGLSQGARWTLKECAICMLFGLLAQAIWWTYDPVFEKPIYLLVKFVLCVALLLTFSFEALGF